MTQRGEAPLIRKHAQRIRLHGAAQDSNRLIRRGRGVLVAIRELERWLDESVALTLEGER